MENNNENFQFFDFPENMEIEIPDETPKKNPNLGIVMGSHDIMKDLKEMAGMTPEQLEKMLPKEGKDELKEISESMGIDFNQMLQNSINMTKALSSGNMDDFVNQIFGAALGGIPAGSCSGNCDECEEEREEKNPYPLGDIKYLQPQYFGSVECIEDDNLYEHFTEKYGLDSTKYLDSNYGIKDSYLTEITAELPLGNIKNLKFIEANNRFILFYAEPNTENVYGFFVAIIKTEDDYALYIPEFRNTFNIVDEVVSLYNVLETEELFTIDNNNGASFNGLNIPSIEFSINFALAPKKKPLLSPHQFGTIKNSLSPIRNNSQFLKVGTITSNESSEAILLKKDAELNLNETTFPFYFNFNRIVDKESLQLIGEIIFKTNLNNAKLLDFTELRYTNDGCLYIDVDIGEF